MSFRRVQKLKLAGYANVMEPSEVQDKNGNIRYELEDKAEVTLPEAELFDLNNIIEAGVDIEEVNSKVMANSTVNADAVVRKYTKKVVNEEKSDN